MENLEQVKSVAKTSFMNNELCQDCNNYFILDSGSTDTHTNDLKILDNYTKSNLPVETASGEMVFSEAVGNVGDIRNIRYTPKFQDNLLSVWHLNELGYKVIFDKNNSHVLIPGKFGDQDITVPIELRGNRLFYVDIRNLTEKMRALVASTRPEENLVTWHQRLHLSDELLMKLSNGKATGMKIKNKDLIKRVSNCESCMICRIKKGSNKKKRERKIPAKCLEEINVDLKTVRGNHVSGYKYVLAFRCARSQFTWLYYLKNKTETKESLQKFLSEVINQHLETPEPHKSIRLKIIKSDCGGEFIGDFEKLCDEKGIKHEQVPAYSQYLNSYVESYWRTLFELTRTFLYHTGISSYYWTYACEYANYILNRTLLHPIKKEIDTPNGKKIKTETKTSYEWLFNALPDLSNIRTFGCDVVSYDPNNDDKALGDRGRVGRFFGFNDKMVHGIYIFNGFNKVISTNYDYAIFNEIISPRFNVNTGEPIEVISLEGQEYSNVRPSDADSNQRVSEDSKESEGDAQQSSEDPKRKKRKKSAIFQESVHQMSRRSGRSYSNLANGKVRHSKKRRKLSKQCYAFNTHVDLSEVQLKLTDGERKILENFIQSYSESGLTDEITAEWLQAIQREKDSIAMNDVFELVPIPEEKPRLLRTKWILNVKQDPVTLVDTIKKARLVIMGNLTKEGIDYFETYSPVAKLTTLRLFLSLVVQLKMHLFQGDVKTAFLNAELEESIYVHLPSFYRLDEFISVLDNDHPLKHADPDKVCLKLKRALYGLKQAPRNWYFRMRDYLIINGFKSCDSEPCLFHLVKDGERVLIFLYVDDFIIASTSEKLLEHYKKVVEMEFNIKSIGYPKKILGISIIKDGDALLIHQQDKIIKLAEEHKLDRGNPIYSPLEHLFRLEKNMNYPISKTEARKSHLANKSPKQLEESYRSLVGSLNHISTATRPDIAYSVSVLSKYLNNPTIRHVFAALRVVRYLYSTMNLVLRYEPRPPKQFDVTAFSDSDWAADSDERISHTGVVITANGTPVHWVSAVQHITTLSSAEAEIVALKQCAKDVLWIRHIIHELFGERNQQFKTTLINVDNSSTIKIVTNPLVSKKNRHMEISYNFIRNHIELGSMKIIKIDGKLNKADNFTKNMKDKHFIDITSKNILIEFSGLNNSVNKGKQI